MKHQIIINSIVILIVVSALAIFVFNKRNESFSDDPNIQPFAIAAINNGNYCKRNLVFPNMNNNAFLASSRSLSSSKILTTGSCNIKRISNNQNDSYSVVHENYMYYVLRDTCIQLSITDIQFNNDIATISVDRSTPQKAKELATFILLNPVFIEFNIDSNFTSWAYFPFYLTNAAAGDSLIDYHIGVNTSPLKIILAPVTNSRFFEYSKQPDTYKSLKSLLNGSKPKILNASVFYLDSMEASGHNIRYTLPLKHDDNKGEIYLFRKEFEAMKNNVREYEFYKNIYMYHVYQAAPILSFKLRIDIPSTISNQSWQRDQGYEANSSFNNERFARKIWADLATVPFNPKTWTCQRLIQAINDKQVISRESIGYMCTHISNNFGTNAVKDICHIKDKLSRPTTIAKVYMGNNARTSLGFYGNNCGITNLDDTVGDSINNIFSLVALPREGHSFRLQLMTGVGNNCNPSATDPNNVYVDLPYVNEQMNILLTISPYEKMIVAYWNTSTESAPQVHVARRRNCNANNNFYQVFVGDNREESAKLDDIFFKYHTSHVKNISYVKLGYVNLYNQIFVEKEE